MGVSSNAILFYGICIDDHTELHERIVEESTAGDEGEPTEGTLAWLWHLGDPDLRCVVDAHCSGEYPMFFIAAQGSVVTAWRGKPKSIEALTVDPDWRSNLAAFCEKYGVPWEEPGWWLVSYWG
jgi:hypothetical protein